MDGATKTVEQEVKTQEEGFLSVVMTPMAASLIAPIL